MEEEKYILHLALLGGTVLSYNFNIMHIEKNVFDNIISTLLNLDGKTNDNLKACQDLKEYGYKK